MRKRNIEIDTHAGATRVEMTEEMWKAAIRHKSDTIDALVRALRDVMGFTDTHNVADLWNEAGESAQYHKAIREAKRLLRQLQRENDLARQWRAD